MNMKTTIVIACMAILVVTLDACGNTGVQDLSGMAGFSKSVDLENRIAGEKIMEAKGGMDYRPGEILVQFKPDVTLETINRIAGDQGLKMIRPVSPQGLYLFKIPEGGSVKESIRELNGRVEVEYSEPNHTRR
jgi:hypothetical protein